MKRFLSLAVAALLAAVMVTGCAKTNTSSTGGSTASGDGASTSAEPVTVTILTVEGGTAKYASKDSANLKAIQKILLEKFNVNWEPEFAVSKDYETTVTTRMASSDLPDIVNIQFASDKLLQLYANGTIIKLNELVEKNAPDITKLYELRPLVKVGNSDSEGNILRIPSQYVENPQHRITVMNMRNDWLKAIGKTYEDIKTPDDYYNALKEFQAKDVNGNGQKDEVANCWGVTGLAQGFGSAFGAINLQAAQYSWYTDDNDKVYNTMLTDGAKAFVTWANKLYTEGLLNQNFLNQTSDEWNALMTNNSVAGTVDAWWGSVLYNSDLVSKGYTEAEFVPFGRPLAVEGSEPTCYVKDLIGYDGYMITKSCKNPDAAMQCINWGYTTEGSQMNYFGEVAPGGDYYQTVKEVPDGITLPDYYMEYTEKGTQAMKDEPELWQKMGWNQTWMTKCLLGNADCVAYEFEGSFPTANLAHDRQFNLDGLKAATETYGVAAVNFATPTTEESAEYSNYGDMWTYMDEMLGKFVTGAESIDNWDSFVAQCKTMGIDKVTELKQADYEAYKKQIQ